MKATQYTVSKQLQYTMVASVDRLGYKGRLVCTVYLGRYR